MVFSPRVRLRLDRFAQRNAPLRVADGFFLRHPWLNRSTVIVYPVIAALIARFVTGSWAAAGGWFVLALVAMLASFVITRANHRRRVANGTSAIYGRPPRKRP